MQKQEVPQKPVTETEKPDLPEWTPPMPPRIGEREWFILFTERFGFLIASGLTLLVLVILFINADRLLQEPESLSAEPITEVQSTPADEQNPPAAEQSASVPEATEPIEEQPPPATEESPVIGDQGESVEEESAPAVEERTPPAEQSTLVAEESIPAEVPDAPPETPDSSAVVMVPLSIATDPALASILIDGQYVGETPLQGVTLAEGTHQIRIQKHNYIRLDTVITLSEATASLQLTLREDQEAILAEQRAAEQAAAEAAAAIDEQQPVASEDEPPTVTPDEDPTTLADEQTTLADEQPATTDEEQPTITDESDLTDPEQTSPLVPEEEDPIVAEEEPVVLVGELQINSEPSGASVLVGGRKVGVTPLLLTGVEPGPQQITLRLDGYDDFIATADVAAQQRSTVTGQLQQAASTLKILAKPWGTIYIDGKLHKSETNIWYTTKLPPGTYSVKIQHATLGTWNQEVTLEPGEERILSVDFN